MRILALVPLLIVAGCSDDEAAQVEKPKVMLAAGQWEMTSEVTKLVNTSPGTPALDEAVGTKTVTKACIAATERQQPKPAMFASAGEDGCHYDNFYMSDGRLNATLMCNHKGKGQLGVTVDGTYSASSMQATLNRDTRFGTPGDVSVAAKLTGRRVGECPAKSEEDDA